VRQRAAENKPVAEEGEMKPSAGRFMIEKKQCYGGKRTLLQEKNTGFVATRLSRSVGKFPLDRQADKC